MPCLELVRNSGAANRFKSDRFRTLHQDGRRLVAHWFTLAHEQLACDPAESFEPFICAWIAFNGWASCCTELDRDREIVQALSLSSELVQQFDRSIEESTSFRTTAERFRGYWPVFKAQELRRLRAPMHMMGDRQGIVAGYFDIGARKFEPACFRRHAAVGEEIPLDWPHVLAAIYQVRCNLFHGDKAPHSEIDRVLVYSGFQILVQFLSRSEYIP